MVPAAGVAGGNPIGDDDLVLHADIPQDVVAEEYSFGMFKGFGRGVAKNHERSR